MAARANAGTSTVASTAAASTRPAASASATSSASSGRTRSPRSRSTSATSRRAMRICYHAREMDWTALFVSLRLATATTAILLVAGVPLAYWLARTTWRGRFLVEAVTALPIVLPPTVLGFYLLYALGPRG